MSAAAAATAARMLRDDSAEPDLQAQLDRRGARQHGVAALGRLAHAGADVDTLVRRALDLLRELVHATTLKPGAGELPAEAAILCADEVPGRPA
jgi:hypothetical protein